MSAHSVRWLRRLGLIVLAGLLLLPACKKKTDQTDGKDESLEWGQSVEGKVTYKDKPVKYGFVQFFSMDAMPKADPKTKDRQAKLKPLCVGVIRNGTYKIPNAPKGPVMVCVFTDPEASPADAMMSQAVNLGPPNQGGPPGGPPGLPGGSPGGPPGGGRPGGGQNGGPPGLPGGGPPVGLPPTPPKEKDGKEPPKIEPPIPKDFKGKMPSMKDKRGPTPVAVTKILAKLTADEKTTLREIHAKYGQVGRSGLMYVVRPGSQTHNIDLK